MTITWLSQDETGDLVTLYFHDSPSDRLRVQIVDYSSVLVDCLNGIAEIKVVFKIIICRSSGAKCIISTWLPAARAARVLLW